MNRTPPNSVRQILRTEVGFGCPVPNCGNPYLEWHHFDPPWRVKQHHEPNGMVALCGEHHSKADANAFTVEQLHSFKINGKKNHAEIKGKFDWLRNKILVVIGGNFYYETLRILTYRDKQLVWLHRNEEGYLLLNLRMLSSSKEPRLHLENNDWIEKGTPIDFECPPSGKLIHAKYSNEDAIRIEFFETLSSAKVIERYPFASPDSWDIEFPITTVEVAYKIGGTKTNFKPTQATVGDFKIQNCFSKNSYGGIKIMNVI